MSEPYYIRPLTVHADKRGTLFEMLRFKDEGLEGQGYIYSYTVNPGERRGDHYHERKDEWLVCVEGAVTLLVETESGDKANIPLEGARPALVYFRPKTAHALVNSGTVPAIIVSYGSKQFDPEDPDTIRKVIA